MTTILITHPCFVKHDTGPGHPERPDRMRAIDKALALEFYKDLARREAPLRDDADRYIALAHTPAHLEHMRRAIAGRGQELSHVDGDTVVSPGTWEAAYRAVGAGLDAVDLVMGGASSERVLSGAPTGPSCGKRTRDGVLFFQQRCCCRPLCPCQTRCRARGRRRF